MGTRGVIARWVDDWRWEGNYHHWDSYPAGLGKALWDAYHGYFQKDVERMLRVLIDEHRAGWSSIVDADWELEPGFVDYDEQIVYFSQGKRLPPQCYCHGARSEKPFDLITSDGDDQGARWCYVIDPETRLITVLHRVYVDVRRSSCKFAAYDKSVWSFAGFVDLEGVEPKWEVYGY